MQSQLLTVGLVAVGLAYLLFFTTIALGFVPSGRSDFWIGFLGNLIADAAVGLVLFSLFADWLEKSKTYKIHLEPVIREKRKAGHVLRLRNAGEQSFLERQIKWFIYVDCSDFESSEHSRGNIKIGTIWYRSYSDILPVPLFVGEAENLITFHVGLNSGDIEFAVVNLRYYLSTAHGTFPQNLGKNPDGTIDLTTLPQMRIKLDFKPTTH